MEYARKLKPNTIIPSSLYVERQADVQVREIIKEMGRPGYVLVARQMGKTNLLINAKRTLERDEDVFAYIDLSNRFETERECFRSIIDKIIDVSQHKLPGLDIEIFKARESATITPHKEHSNELRKILSAISGKLIIILDEVDSLTSAKYSDKIFAQIRSVYFDRISYPEYERLSYIISGVAEPSEIIKDKSISPFNIGQKILLGDFSESEYKSFLKKANVQFDLTAINRVFYWANGNPRMTWDICSVLEEKLLAGDAVDETFVDKVVHELYLAKNDIPPVDHIRSLVENDKSLRQAILSIHNVSDENISEGIKSKLYLSGIISFSDYDSNGLKIKNRIIESCLSAEWIKSINARESVTLLSAADLFSRGEYQDAAEMFSVLAEMDELQSKDRLISKLQLGVCYARMGENERAINYYKENPISCDEDEQLHTEQLYQLGLLFISEGKYSEALKYLSDVIAKKTSDHHYGAMVTMASMINADRSLQGQYGDPKKILDSVIDAKQGGLKVSQEAISTAYYMLGSLSGSESAEEAFEYYKKSYESAPNDTKVAPLIAALNLNLSSRAWVWEKIIDVVSNNKINVDLSGDTYSLKLSHLSLSDLVSISICNSELENLEAFFEGIIRNWLPEKSDLSKLFIKLAKVFVWSGKKEEAEYVCRKIISLGRSISDSECVFFAKKYISYVSPDADILESYFKGFQNYISDVDKFDIAIFEKTISDLIVKKDYERASKFCDLITSVGVGDDGISRANLIYIYYLKLRSLDGHPSQKEYVVTLRKMMDEITDEELKFSKTTKDRARLIMIQINRTWVKLNPVVQIKNTKPLYQRNDKVTVRYLNGKLETKKYKAVIDDINKGLCQLVE